MKKVMFLIVCVCMLGGTNAVMAQDPVKPATEKKAEKKEPADEKKECCKDAKKENAPKEDADKKDADKKEAKAPKQEEEKRAEVPPVEPEK